MKNWNVIIESCSKCKSNPKISDYIILSKPLNFIGSENPKIMLIGHSPAVRTKEPAKVVLKLNKENQPLYKYITENILQPLNIPISKIYATNLIKCHTTKLPEDMGSPVCFFNNCFNFCKNLLEKEIEDINPHLIISLSGRVLKILSKNYIGRELSMKNSFGKLHHLVLNEKEYNYIPLVHIPKGNNSLVAKYYFPEQTERLLKIRKVLF